MAMVISRKYEVIGQLGRGGMGLVYKVHHTALETILALKVLPSHLMENQEMVARFYREARAMAQLRHSNIVRVLDIDRDEELNFCYFVMEYIQGKTLSQYLGERGPLPLAEVLAIARQMASALAYAHEHNPPIIHRDIKPANIMIEDGSGRVVVMDFGIAKVLGQSELTKSQVMIGTVKYCSPEQMRHEPLDGRADIYSLGLVLYEMFTGKQFFAGLDEHTVIGKVLYEPQENEPHFTQPTPAAFVALIAKAIAKARDKRYQRMADLLRDLERCQSELGDAETIRLPAPGTCSGCGFENPAGIKFCIECAAPLKNRCPNCGFENPLGAKFCGECATSLTRQTPAPSPVQTEQPLARQQAKATRGGPLSAGRVTSEAERRQLTMMYCSVEGSTALPSYSGVGSAALSTYGVEGSTALSRQLDLEDLHEVVREFQEVCAEVIRRFEGYIAQYLSDGLLVYFGYPMAHEDDAYRAIRTGLAIVEEMGRLNSGLERERGVRLVVRLGIHTGVVVLGEMGRGDKREHLAMGDAPSIAAQLQGLAEPNTVVVSPASYRLIEGNFACQALGSHTFKGLSQPMTVYRVLQESAAQSRLEVAVTKGLTPLVGREQEAGLLVERWDHVKEGMGQVVLLSGEAGIGKSRLVQVLKERIAGEAHARVECRCSPYYQNSALYPVIEHLQRLLRFRGEDSPQEKLSKLEGALGSYGFALEEVVPLFASLLSLPLPDRYPPLTLTSQQQKQKTLEALLAWRLRETERHVTLSVWEDLQWVDPSTLEFLSLLIAQAPTARILVLLTFRPDFIPPWANRSHHTQIALSRFTHRQVEAMVVRVTGGKALPVEVLQQIVAKTDGVPLFVEELTKMVLESGLLREREDRYEPQGPLPPLAIPATLHDSLMARLDRLGTAKQVAQLGATLGKDFPYEWIQAVSPVDEGTLQRDLARLVDADLFYQRGLPPQARYFFKHALIQDAAYQSLLRSKRQQYHRQIAQVLEERFRETTETQPELLAHHYTEAGVKKEAIVYWQRAGRRAIERSAHVEAIGHLTKGLELLKTLPDTPERTQQELTLYIALGSSLIATKGYAAQEVEQAYIRARELCQQVGDTPQLFSALVGLWRYYNVRAESQTAHELGKQLLSLAQGVQDVSLRVVAHFALGAPLFMLGELVPARAHLEQALALYDPQQHHSMVSVYASDLGVHCLCYYAWTLWWLGYPDQALNQIHEALTLAQQFAYSHTLAFALGMAARLHHFRRERQTAQERAEAVIALAAEQGLPFWVAQGTIVRGWALAEQGQEEEGIEQIRQGLVIFRATEGKLALPELLSRLAEACAKGGQIEEGLTVLAEALAMVHRGASPRHYTAELYRLKGEFLLALSLENQAEAETCFRQAVDTARRQSAKSWELRAVMSLSRLWQQQGKHAEAHRMLAEIHSWFTEGFDTPDLQEAKALLEELA